MIKNYEDFVNEGFRGFLDSVITGIETGVSGYKSVRKANAAAEAEAERILKSGDENVSEVGVDTQLAVAVRQLMTTVSLFAEHFVDAKLAADVEDAMQEVKHIEMDIEKIKELLPQYCEEQNRY